MRRRWAEFRRISPKNSTRRLRVLKPFTVRVDRDHHTAIPYIATAPGISLCYGVGVSSSEAAKHLLSVMADHIDWLAELEQQDVLGDHLLQELALLRDHLAVAA